MLSLTVKELRGHGRRLVGTALAVFLGVAFLAGTLVLGDTLRNNFDELFTEVNAGTDIIVRNATDLGIEADEPRGLIDRTLVDRVAAVDGVAAAEPQIQGLGPARGAARDAGGRAGGGGGARHSSPAAGPPTRSSPPTAWSRAGPRRPTTRW